MKKNDDNVKVRLTVDNPTNPKKEIQHTEEIVKVQNKSIHFLVAGFDEIVSGIRDKKTDMELLEIINKTLEKAKKNHESVWTT